MHINIQHCTLHGKLGQITNFNQLLKSKVWFWFLKNQDFSLTPTDRDHIKVESLKLSWVHSKVFYQTTVCTFLQHQRDLNAQWRGWIWGSSSSTTSIQPTTPIPPSRFGCFSDVGASD